MFSRGAALISINVSNHSKCVQEVTLVNTLSHSPSNKPLMEDVWTDRRTCCYIDESMDE